MEERNNSFKHLEEKWAAALPPELERRVSNQTAIFNTFGKVVELFMPNALQTAAHMIGGPSDGSESAGFFSGRRAAPDEWPDWRTAPGRTDSPGGKR